MIKIIVIVLCSFVVGCATDRLQATTLPTQHIVQRNEVLSQIARRYYGNDNVSEGITAILKANPDMKTAQSGPGIQAGPIVLIIPKLNDN